MDTGEDVEWWQVNNQAAGWWLVEWDRQGRLIGVSGGAVSDFEQAISVPMPYGPGMVITSLTMGRPSSSKDKDWGGGGKYTCEVGSTGKPGISNVEGRVLVDGQHDPNLRILVVWPYAANREPGTLGYDPVVDKAIAYKYVAPGELWQLETSGSPDIYLFAPGWSIVKYENIPIISSEFARLPDITLVPSGELWVFYR